jgi:hypothetical protein
VTLLRKPQLPGRQPRRAGLSHSAISEAEWRSTSKKANTPPGGSQLSCSWFVHNDVRVRLHALAYNFANHFFNGDLTKKRRMRISNNPSWLRLDFGYWPGLYHRHKYN